MDDHTARSRSCAWQYWIAFAAGIVSGICWFSVGERLDDHMGNFLAWYVMPAVPPCVVVAICAVVRCRRCTGGENLRRSLAFVVTWYIAHWLPLVVFVAVVTAGGGM
jgi:hypothetical protein